MSYIIMLLSHCLNQDAFPQWIKAHISSSGNENQWDKWRGHLLTTHTWQSKTKNNWPINHMFCSVVIGQKVYRIYSNFEADDVLYCSDGSNSVYDLLSVLIVVRRRKQTMDQSIRKTFKNEALYGQLLWG